MPVQLIWKETENLVLEAKTSMTKKKSPYGAGNRSHFFVEFNHWEEVNVIASAGSLHEGHL